MLVAMTKNKEIIFKKKRKGCPKSLKDLSERSHVVYWGAQNSGYGANSRALETALLLPAHGGFPSGLQRGEHSV